MIYWEPNGKMHTTQEICKSNYRDFVVPTRLDSLQINDLHLKLRNLG
jgi:hypothetical protein